MKSILISIKPKHCANILNGIKTIEIRKRFQKDYRGWIYIYCTKDKEGLWLSNGKHCLLNERKYVKSPKNGKVIARFYCDNVEEIKFINPNRTCGFSCEVSDYDCYYNINENECCLSQDDLYDYLQGKNGYAIHISQLEIFDTPKELSEFYVISCDQKKNPCNIKDVFGLEECERICKKCKHIKRPPQNLMYIETDETR